MAQDTEYPPYIQQYEKESVERFIKWGWTIEEAKSYSQHLAEQMFLYERKLVMQYYDDEARI